MAAVEEPASIRDFLDGWAKYTFDHPQQRAGQCAFNYLWETDREGAEQIWSGPLDPFYVDERLPLFMKWLIQRYTERLWNYKNSVEVDSE